MVSMIILLSTGCVSLWRNYDALTELTFRWEILTGDKSFDRFFKNPPLSVVRHMICVHHAISLCVPLSFALPCDFVVPVPFIKGLI